MRFSLLLTSLCCFLPSISVQAGPASPEPHIYKQPDGSDTPELILNGDERYAWLSDSSGFTVIRDESKYFVYAQKNEQGELESTGVLVGQTEPASLGLEPYLMPNEALFEEDIEQVEEESLHRRLGRAQAQQNCQHRATSSEPCSYKQLALSVRFQDHATRMLPPPEEIFVLFNHNGPTGNSTASTGSISDIYRANSFDTFVLDTHVTPWQDIDCTEAYAAAGKNGFNQKETRECWAKALKKYAESLPQGGLSAYDKDGDKYIDGLVIVHSGVAAESSGDECETGAHFSDRIWSHAVPKSPIFEFLSENNINLGGYKVGRFYVISGILGTCPPAGPGTQWPTTRIAVGSHEAGHFLGLPDLYGLPGKSNGIGNWGFMGNMYGWDTSQNWPGLMSGYSRHLLGWVEIVDIEYSRTVEIVASCDSDKIYRIKHRMGKDNGGGQDNLRGEYFLLENRNACGHDLKLLHGGQDRQGVAIWYVDHTMLRGQNAGRDVIRYNTHKTPSDPAWPMTHARVSLVQGDGEYGMELLKDRGSRYDTFRRVPSEGAFSAYKISNAGLTMNDGSTKDRPNTKSIAHGEERETGIAIEVKSAPNYIMVVEITLTDENGNVVGPESQSAGNQGQGQGQGQNPAPTSSAPTPRPTPGPTEDPGLQIGGTQSGALGAGADITTIGSGSGIFGSAFSGQVNVATPNPTDSPTPEPTPSPVTSDPTPQPTSAVPTKAPTPLPEGSTFKPTTLSPTPAPTTKSPTPSPTTKSPTPAPTKSPTPAPTESPTPQPTPQNIGDQITGNGSANGASLAGTQGSNGLTGQSTYACDNSPDQPFQFMDDNVIKYRVCGFINPAKRDPEHWCAVQNMLDGSQPVYKTCQRQCHHVTQCDPPPIDDRRLRRRDP